MRSRMTVNDRSVGASASRELSMRCDLCGKSCYARFPYQPTRQQRLDLMRSAMEEHRRLCKVGTPEDRRTYTLLYA